MNENEITSNINIINGFNGSGKTTLAKKLSNKFNCKVFNENYIDNNIKFSEDDNLNVIIEDNKSYEDNIEILKLDKQISNKINDSLLLTKKIDDLKSNEENGINSFYKKIKKELNTNFSKEISKLKGNKTIKYISDYDILNFIHNEDKENYPETYKELKEKISKVNVNNVELIEDNYLNNTLEKLLKFKKYSNSIVNVLRESIQIKQNIELSYEDNLILSLVLKNGTSVIDNNTICPHCYQNISNDLKIKIKDLIEKNNLSNSNKDELNKLKNKINIIEQLIDIDLSKLNKFKNFNLIQLEFNKLLLLLKEKSENIYSSVNFNNSNINILVNELIDYINNIKINQKEYYDILNSKKELIKKAEKILLQEIKNNLSLVIKTYNILKDEFELLENKKIDLENEINKLENQKHNILKNLSSTINVEYMNNIINQIMQNLKIVYENNEYKVKVNNNYVKIQNLSSSEKVSIGLAYYLINEKPVNYIVIDDLFTHFDYINLNKILKNLVNLFINIKNVYIFSVPIPAIELKIDFEKIKIINIEDFKL